MSSEVEINATEKWVNLEDIAEHLSVSQDTCLLYTSPSPRD